MKIRTLKDLRTLVAELTTLPEDTPVVSPGPDHSYTPGVEMTTTTALQEGPKSWCEDHGEAATPEATYGKRVRVLVVE